MNAGVDVDVEAEMEVEVGMDDMENEEGIS